MVRRVGWWPTKWSDRIKQQRKQPTNPWNWELHDHNINKIENKQKVGILVSPLASASASCIFLTFSLLLPFAFICELFPTGIATVRGFQHQILHDWDLGWEYVVMRLRMNENFGRGSMLFPGRRRSVKVIYHSHVVFFLIWEEPNFLLYSRYWVAQHRLMLIVWGRSPLLSHLFRPIE